MKKMSSIVISISVEGEAERKARSLKKGVGAEEDLLWMLTESKNLQLKKLQAEKEGGLQKWDLLKRTKI